MSQVVTRKPGSFKGPKPEILAPAGQRDSFLAALAAGADAIYCGLKDFSARMAAKNFQPGEMAALVQLAHAQGVKVHLTLNTLLKPDELAPLGRRLEWLNRHACPDALIVQDLAAVALAKQVGYSGEIHLSTLANVTQPAMLPRLFTALGVQRVVLPRELNVDEIKQMAAACPPELGLEVFVHGALCYGVSGRCYWSSFLGGKSGLRGRCVQPCRRRYVQGGPPGLRHFACQDLSLDVLVKVLAGVPQVRAWKIEGRKKGPHYVYYAVSAYKMLRDEGQDPEAKRSAVGLLEQALGRPGTHYHFLSQRPQNPVDTQRDTGSGLLIGNLRGARDKAYFEPRQNLLEGDKLRLGYEDDEWHQTIDVKKGLPKGGRFFVKVPKGPAQGETVPVFLIDRREDYLAQEIERYAGMLEPVKGASQEEGAFVLRLPPGTPRPPQARRMHVLRTPRPRLRQSGLGLWLAEELAARMQARQVAQAWWWLPPAIWPAEEEHWRQLIRQVISKGAQRFVLNAPWQMALFQHDENLNLWAGPFCNIANPLAVRSFKLLGGQGVIVSPELGRADLEALPAKSVLPLGMVISGHWPFCVSRVLSPDLKPGQPFVSPRGEEGWVQRHGELYWVYPNWTIDLQQAQDGLIKAGYRLFIHLDETVPRSVRLKKRPGLWNLDLGLK